MKRAFNIINFSFVIYFASTSIVQGAPTPPLCIDSICLEDEIHKLKDVDWEVFKAAKASQSQWNEALEFWATIFPTTNTLSLRKHKQNLVNRKIDKNIITFLEARPAVCRFEKFNGNINKGEEVLSVTIAPDTDYQWRVIKLTKHYRSIPNPDHIASYVTAVKNKYSQWTEDDHWGDAEAPVNWDTNPHYSDYSFSFSLRHLVNYGSTKESARNDWARSFDHFIEHREYLSEYGIDSIGSWNSDNYNNLFKNSEACTPNVSL